MRKQARMRTGSQSSSVYSSISHAVLFQESLALFGKKRANKKTQPPPNPKLCVFSDYYMRDRLYLETLIISISSYVFCFLAFVLGSVFLKKIFFSLLFCFWQVLQTTLQVFFAFQKENPASGKVLLGLN